MFFAPLIDRIAFEQSTFVNAVAFVVFQFDRLAVGAWDFLDNQGELAHRSRVKRGGDDFIIVGLGRQMKDGSAAPLSICSVDLLAVGIFQAKVGSKRLTGKGDLVKLVLIQLDRVRFAKTFREERVLEVGVLQLVGEDDVLGGLRGFLVAGRTGLLAECNPSPAPARRPRTI